jgi:hypothetical protein
MLWKELIFLLSVQGQPAKAVLEQTSIGVFFIHSEPDTIFGMFFLPKLLADYLANCCGPQFEKH